MKIGVIAHIKHPIALPFAGGLEAFTHEMVRKLIARGEEVVLFASSRSDAGLPIYPILSDDNYDALAGSRSKKPNVSSLYMEEHHAYFELMMAIDRLGLDLIFNNSLHYVPITMASLLRTPMLTVLHTPPFFELKEAVKREYHNGRMRYVTVSGQNKVNWRPYLPQCAVVPNGIDLSKWTYSPRHTGPYAFWYGRIHPDKGLPYAIRAAKLAGMPLKVAGRICDEAYYKKEIFPLLNDGVELLGHLSQTELNKLVGNASVCLITPIWEEPFGLVVAESLACGTPVAGFGVGALPALLTPETSRLVAPKDSASLAKAMREASRLDRDSCRALAEARFDVEHMVDAYQAIFREMVLEKKLEGHAC